MTHFIPKFSILVTEEEACMRWNIFYGVKDIVFKTKCLIFALRSLGYKACKDFYISDILKNPIRV